jgi:hypothetical protein
VAIVVFVLHSDAAPLPEEQQQALINKIEEAAMAQIRKATNERPWEHKVVIEAKAALKDMHSMATGDHEVVEDMKKEETEGLADTQKIQQANQLDDAKDVKEVRTADDDAQAMSKQVQNQAEHMDAAFGEAIKREQNNLSNLQKAKLTASKKQQLGESDVPAVNFRDPGLGTNFGERVRVISEAANAAVQNAKASAVQKQEALKDDEKRVEAQSTSIMKAMARAKGLLDGDIGHSDDAIIEQDIKNKAEDEMQHLTGFPVKSLGESMNMKMDDHKGPGDMLLGNMDAGQKRAAEHGMKEAMKEYDQANGNGKRLGESTTIWRPLGSDNAEMPPSQSQAGLPSALEAAEQAATQAAKQAATQATEQSEAGTDPFEQAATQAAKQTPTQATEQAAIQNSWGATTSTKEQSAMSNEAGTDPLQAAEQQATAAAGASAVASVSNTADHQAIANDAHKLRQFQASALKEMDNQQALTAAIEGVQR